MKITLNEDLDSLEKTALKVKRDRDALLYAGKHALSIIETVSGVKGTYWREVENTLRSAIDIAERK